MAEMSETSAAPVCAVVGVGPGNGAAFARRFAAEGHAVALLARTLSLTSAIAPTLPRARPYRCDVTDRSSVEAAFSAVRDELGEVDTVIYNAGSGVWGSLLDVTPQDFEASWRVNALGTFLVAQAVVASMQRRGRGCFIVIGATASRRGGARTAAFAPAKAAQRGLAESMAKSLGPSGIHVALIVVDGIVDLPRTRERLADKPDNFFVQPDDVAEIAYRLFQQRPSAWSFEVDARPFGETW